MYENWILDPLWEHDVRRLDAELMPDLGNVATLAARLPLRFFGHILLDPQRWLPRAGVFLPTMPPETIQTSWTGNAGEPLLNQSVEFIRTAVSSLANVGISAASADVLDFGVGWGRLARLWLKYAPPSQLSGCDSWQISLDAARGSSLQNRLELSTDLLDPLPFPEGSFDAAYAFSVFTHLSPTAFACCLRGIAQMLRPGGAVLFTVRPESYWEVPPIARGLVDRGIDLTRFSTDEATFVPHEGRVNYGDSSFSRSFIEQHCDQAGLRLHGFEWSIFDEYQVVITAVRQS